MLPSTVFESALREAEERAPFIAVVDAGGVPRGGEAAFLEAMREECARRGWIQTDRGDPQSWVFSAIAER